MVDPHPWMPSVRKKNRLAVFLVNEKGFDAPYVSSFKNAVAAFNSFDSQICVRLDIVNSEGDANVKAYRLRYGKKVKVGWPDAPDQVLDGTKRQDAAHTWVMEYEGKTKRAEIIGAAVGVLVTNMTGKEDPAMTKLFLIHEFIHAAGLDNNQLHDASGKDVFAGTADSSWNTAPPDPLLGEKTISKLKSIWCAASGQKLTLNLDSRPHQA
jgi:hypothetical protein